jgi:hypothetical protein
MPNTAHTQLPRNVFTQQSSTANGLRTRGVVRQDKIAPPRDRVASNQPASPQNPARPHHMDGKIARLHKRSTRRKTVPGTIWMSAAEKTALRQLADSEGLSFSQAGRHILVEGIEQKLRIKRDVLAEPAITAAMHKEMTRLTNNLAEFQGRILFEVGQLRWLYVNKMYWEVLNPDKTLTKEEYRGLLKTSIDETMKNLHRYVPQIAEVVAAIKKWFAAGEAGT